MADNTVRVEVLPDGRVKFKIKKPGGDGIVAHMTPQQGSELMRELLQAGVLAWIRDPKNDFTKPGRKLPLEGMEDIHTKVTWPLSVAVITAAADEERKMVGLYAAYGDLQVAVGLQRSLLRPIAEQLLRLDESLPPSNELELGLLPPKT